MSGKIQGINQTNPNSKITSTTTTAAAAPSTITTDFDIFATGSSINPTNYVYDGQTVLMINSTLSPNSNIVKAQYFDPVTGYPNSSASGSTGFGNWNFDLVQTSYLNGTMSSSSLLSESTSIYSNLQPYNSSLGLYNIDIVNSGLQTSGGDSTQTEFFSLTAQPYATTSGEFVDTPTYNNINPGYSSNNSDNFIFTSNYYVQQKNEIIIVQLVFTVTNTNALNVLNTSTSNTPSVSVIVYNKVITQETLAGLSNGSGAKTKVYSAGPIPLQYMQGGSTFNPINANYNINNNVPIIIADGYSKLYATLPLIYVPPILSGSTYYPQYLNQGTDSKPGYVIESNVPYIPTTGSAINGTTISSSQVLYGHFVVGVAYSNDFSTYNPGSYIYSEVLIKNIWRSPISIYSSYQAFSVNDMATKLVVLLFGKTNNGGTFLVTNTGTPLSLINNYAVTSLRNFMNIMKAVINTFDGSSSLVDYFINPNTVQQVNSTGSYNIQILTLQPLLEGAITNPQSVLSCPNMYYMFLNSKNSTNMSIDPSNQIVFGQNIGQSYFGLSNSTLCAGGNLKYYNSSLNILATNNNELFANSIYLGQNISNGQTFYMLLILPEALFNGNALDTTNNIVSVYTSSNTLFYINASSNTSTKFSEDAYVVSSTGTSTSTFNVSKLIMSASNITLF